MPEMSEHQQIVDVVGSAARRLMLARIIESAAAATAAGVLCAAAVELGWLLAARFPVAAVVVCALPIAASLVVVLLLGATDVIRDRAVAALSAALCAAAGALGTWSVTAGWSAGLSRALPPVVIVLCAALAAVVLELLRGASPLEAAALLDARHNLQERVSTATELAAASGNRSLRDYVCRQALAAIRQADAARRWPWRRGSGPAAALALGILLCVVVAAVPPPAGPQEAARIAAVVAEIERLSLERKRRTARRLQQLSRQAEDERLAEMLRRADEALRTKDGAELARLIEELKAAGVDVESVFGKDLLAAAGATGMQGAGKPPAPVAAQPLAGEPTATQAARPRFVRVYDPDLAKRAAPADAAAVAADPTGPFISRQTAWQAARSRMDDARQADSTGLSSEYRRMVREFFSED